MPRNRAHHPPLDAESPFDRYFTDVGYVMERLGVHRDDSIAIRNRPSVIAYLEGAFEQGKSVEEAAKRLVQSVTPPSKIVGKPRRSHARSRNRTVASGSKPLILQKVGKQWTVYLDVPVARAFGGKGSGVKYPDAVLPFAKTAKGYDFVAGGTAAKLTKDMASHVAHKVGRYMLGFGDFVDTYTEERRT